MHPGQRSSVSRLCATSHRAPLVIHSVLRAVGKATVPFLVVAMASAGPAAAKAARSPAYPAKVQAVLDHLQKHPMTVASLAMQYDAEPTTPLPDAVQGITAADVMIPSSSKGSSSSSSGAGSGGSSSSAQSDHMARVVAGLLYAACGGLDQAHNLVTPLCWGSWTPYAGNPVSNSPAAAEAAYVHAIVHRQEGRCIGEFGSGFSNANYWYRAAGELPIMSELLQAAKRLAAGKPRCEAHVAKHGDRWRPSTFVALCDEVAGSRDPELTVFCEGVMAAEMQQLLRWCYDHM